MPKSYKLKLMLLGSSGSGKTSFISGHNNNDWPIGISFKIVECYANENDIYKFLIWDLKDRPRFHFMFKDFCRGAHAGLLCFDLSDRNSFNALNFWINLLREGSGNVPIILIGTKNDLENREVQDQEILDFIQEENLETIFFTSIFQENDTKQEIFRLFRFAFFLAFFFWLFSFFFITLNCFFALNFFFSFNRFCFSLFGFSFFGFFGFNIFNSSNHSF